MLKYPCLVLDHDDTVVKSEITVNYPCFLESLEKFRPGETMGYQEFVSWCFRYEFTEFLRIKYGFTDAELFEEYTMWQTYSKTRIPPAYDGIREIILEQKRRGGLVCVASLSSKENILRDYREHIGIEPDMIFSCNDPKDQRKPNPYPLQTIMKTYGLSPTEVLMVDDLKTGYEMASAAGVPIAFAAWSRLSNPDVMEQMEKLCDHSFHTTEDLRNFLFK
jgi:phosphoglycolate phosphatase/pyrophosphatase PpaX